MVYIIIYIKILQKSTDRCDGHVAVGDRRCPMTKRINGNANFTAIFYAGDSFKLFSATVLDGFDIGTEYMPEYSMKLNNYYREMVIADGYYGGGRTEFVFVLKDESEDEYGLATANPYSLDLLEHYWRGDYNYIEAPVVGGELFLIVNDRLVPVRDIVAYDYRHDYDNIFKEFAYSGVEVECNSDWATILFGSISGLGYGFCDGSIGGLEFKTTLGKYYLLFERGLVKKELSDEIVSTHVHVSARDVLYNVINTLTTLPFREIMKQEEYEEIFGREANRFCNYGWDYYRNTRYMSITVPLYYFDGKDILIALLDSNVECGDTVIKEHVVSDVYEVERHSDFFNRITVEFRGFRLNYLEKFEGFTKLLQRFGLNVRTFDEALYHGLNRNTRLKLVGDVRYN